MLCYFFALRAVEMSAVMFPKSAEHVFLVLDFTSLPFTITFSAIETL